jgi:hypothetical protein
MRTTRYVLLAIVMIWPHAGSATSARAVTQFEGPYHIATTAPKQIRATVKSVYQYPNLLAQEWMIAYSLPPVFDGQPSARGKIAIADMPSAEPGRTNDETGMHQPLATLHWVPDTVEAGHGFTAIATYDVTITRRTLEPGEPPRPVNRLTRAERSAFLAPSNHFDFTGPKFQGWLRKFDLKRSATERDLDFAHRAMETMV